MNRSWKKAIVYALISTDLPNSRCSRLIGLVHVDYHTEKIVYVGTGLMDHKCEVFSIHWMFVAAMLVVPSKLLIMWLLFCLI